MGSDDNNPALLPQVAIIAAMTRDRVIGSAGGLPWALPEDLRLFKQITKDSTIIMGRKTYEAIGKPLPDRQNVVLSRAGVNLPGVQVCGSFMAALAFACKSGRPVFVIGGAELYRKALPVASELHISWVKGFYDGDIFFPEFSLEDWETCVKTDYPGFCYIRYRRKNVPGLHSID